MSQWCNDGKEMYKITCTARAELLFANTNILFFAVFLAVAVVAGFVVIQKWCFHGNVTSHFYSLLSLSLIHIGLPGLILIFRRASASLLYGNSPPPPGGLNELPIAVYKISDQSVQIHLIKNKATKKTWQLVVLRWFPLSSLCSFFVGVVALFVVLFVVVGGVFRDTKSVILCHFGQKQKYM